MADNPNDLFFNDDDAVEEPPAISAEEENQPADTENNEPQDIALAVTKKKRALKPQPKLDVRRLMGPRGLPCLDKEFEGVKFRGHNNEVEDLDTLMSHLEHWAHRLYPKMTFVDCLERIERLGHKKEIQTCMKKLRIGMPLLNASEGTTMVTEDDSVEPMDGNEDEIDSEILNLPMNDDF